jgi:hypothetical protein
MFYYDCECKDMRKILNLQIFSSENKKPSVSRQSVSKTNYLKTNLLKQIKKISYTQNVFKKLYCRGDFE